VAGFLYYSTTHRGTKPLLDLNFSFHLPQPPFSLIMLLGRGALQHFICRKEKDPKKWGHHQHIAYELTKISKGKGGRLIVNMPPRHTKSEFASYLFPAWYIGKFPKKK
jgi:hypothetical protein